MIKITTRRIQISRFGSQELSIPELDGLDLSKVVVKTEGGQKYNLKSLGKPKKYILSSPSPTPGVVVMLEFWLNDGQSAETQIQKIETVPAPEKPKPKTKSAFFAALQARRQKSVALNLQEIKAIREKSLNHKNLSGKKVLTFDYTGCWARGLGMIQKAKQLQHELKKPLHDHYDRLCGQGDGAIIAAAFAVGINFDNLAAWWINDWRKVHSPKFPQKIKRWTVSKFKPNSSGYDAKKARAALQKLFLKAPGADSRMEDALSELQITIIQADMKISTHLSSENSKMEIYAAVEDSAVTKISYNQRETIKGEAVFLGAIEKNDDLGLMLSENNKKLEITSIGAPVRVDPPAAKNLKKLGHAADKVALQSAGHFIYKRRVKQLIGKLGNAGYEIVYNRIECLPIDNIVCNNTTDEAMRAGLESGSGRLRATFKEAL